jgi:hypothetical protein
VPGVVGLEPDGGKVEPLGEVLAPIVLPDGFMPLLAPLFTAPDVPADVVPEPAVPALAPAEPPALPPACANAREDVRAKAEANAMVAIFMSFLQLVSGRK